MAWRKNKKKKEKRKTTKSYRKYSVRIQRHEAYVMGLLTPSSKRRCLCGEGQFVSIKQISAKFLWHPAAVTNSSKRNHRGGQQAREGCFHFMSTTWWRVSTSLAYLSPFILSLSTQVNQAAEFTGCVLHRLRQNTIFNPESMFGKHTEVSMYSYKFIW